MVPEIPLGKQAVHPPFMMLTQVENRKQEEGENRR
jgi:hypothetical protein